MKKVNLRKSVVGTLLAVLLLPQQATAADEKEILYWVAPMDANYRRDKPGKSPMGMELVPVYADEAGAGGDGVTIAPEVVQNLGVRTAVAERSRLWRGIDTVGYVDYDESKVSHIHLRTDGWIERLYVKSKPGRCEPRPVAFDVPSGLEPLSSPPNLAGGEIQLITKCLGSRLGVLLQSCKEPQICIVERMHARILH